MSAIPAGYKQSEVGVIPEDWEAKRLGELATVTAGGTPSRANELFWHGDIPWITTTEVNARTINSAEQFISKEGLSNSAAKLLPPGTLLMALYGQGKTRGKVGILGIEAATNQACASISLRRGALGNFILHFLRSQYEAIRNLSNTGSQENLNNFLVRSIQIRLPPEAEQEAISEALSDADALIESLEQLVTKKRYLKQGVMQDLLTGKKRLPGFSGDWEAKQLGEIGTFLKGRGVTRHQSSGGSLACVRYGEIYTRHDDYITEFFSWIARDVALCATRLQYGDILFAGSGETKAEIGKCAAFIDKFEAYAGGDIVIFRAEKSDPLFLGYYLNTSPINQQKASRGQGDAVVHISSGALASIQGKFPTLLEQRAIGAVLFDMDAEIADLEAQLAKARAIKQGMMNQLLTGKIRLI
ncbi:restriction endonuclease subunit S [Massilia sp. DJPM01]|uniref:restriction endonuclease subunit S n=1 Tax=Massilia sp. DJPM01 TaxID=3024404 RepID=UPI00259DDBF7|nr:restriction endonuclease subunit S [Massilia sp. DJPM01]MDM5176267.1 restriction endonuclease subunit S [Massilia sp. DJPM01]